MWKRTAAGLTLSFHLAGINNQNFLMRDDQTGTFWQQISGRAVSGPLAGSQLELVYSDELSFALWRSEAPNGTVLQPVQKYAREYEAKDWDVRMAKVRTVLDFPDSGLRSRDLVLGVEASNTSRAYPMSRILSEKLIEDHLGSRSLLVVLGPDGKSVRVFEGRLPGLKSESDFYRNREGTASQSFLIDSVTGSDWNFEGCAVAGKLKGSCLAVVPAIKDYWFDWRNYHSATTVFRR